MKDNPMRIHDSNGTSILSERPVITVIFAHKNHKSDQALTPGPFDLLKDKWPYNLISLPNENMNCLEIFLLFLKTPQNLSPPAY